MMGHRGAHVSELTQLGLTWGLILQRLVFERVNVQSGMDLSGIATDMLTLNSTVKIFYRNTGTFFGVDVKVAPIRLLYYKRSLASGPVSTSVIYSSFPLLKSFRT